MSISPVSTMDLRYFVPSEQLAGHSNASSQANRGNGNYRGDVTLSINTGAHVLDHQNTNLWITGLPATIDTRELLGAIKGVGKIRSTVINSPTGDIVTAAASISFFSRQDAAKLYHKIEHGMIRYRGITPNVQWNRNRVGASEVPAYASRVLMIAGDPAIVNEEFLSDFFARKFVYELDQVIDHGVVDGFGGPIGRVEFRFGSWRSQASSARLALMLELKGFLIVHYGPDPCAH
ncbi:hypothetical protein F5Y02DRAFT_421259 [Annulohypoxylon stygium]|nr:hypothetical protein F5Y02DRAFT_421259 [Annulohypoxylon stygium]